MKKILRIARIELSILFYSPIAWLMLIIFIIQCGIGISDLIEAKEASQQMGNKFTGLTMDIYGGGRGFFNMVKNNLYLYIPLLTMGLMSRELSSGSIKLLQSSPITNRQIILGKYLAIVGYCFLLVIVMIAAVGIGLIAIENLDITFTFGAILGLFFLACAYAAIGLFMSSLTTYQVVAAISTLAVFAALNFMSSVGQSIEFVRDITYWLAMSSRVDNFIIGLISSKDVIYFLLIISTFLVLTIMRLNAAKSTARPVIKNLKYTAVIVTVLIIGYLSSLTSFTGYYDTTRFKTRTLTPKTQALLKQLKEPVKITVYANVLNSFAHLASPRFRIFDLKQFDDYTRFLPNLEITYQPYYNYTLDQRDNTDKTLEERAKRAITAYGFDFDNVLSPNEINKIIDLTPELNGFVRVLSYQGKTANLHMFFDNIGYPKESEISAAVKNVLYGAPVIGILTGNYERGIDKRGDKEYKTLLNELNVRSSLINQGFNLKNIAFDSNKPLPLDLTVLVVADPIEAYSAEQMQQLKSYIQQGGNILIAGEPYKQALLNPLLQEVGIEYTSGMLLEESEDYNKDLIQAKITPEAKALGFNIKEKSVITMPNSMAIKILDSTNFTITPLLTTNPSTVWNQEGRFNLKVDSVSFDPMRHQKKKATVGVALSRELNGSTQKVIVLGDADVLSNKEISRSNVTQQENYNFAVASFKWFTDGAYPIDATRTNPIDNKITMNAAQLGTTKLIFIGLFPLSLALIGAIILIKRKRQ
ncbi:Gldg family protein [Flavobacteriaceae bacterium F08102]|nr:Gldg family protein [Flavobacteriaceae bacterium F08102]